METGQHGVSEKSRKGRKVQIRIWERHQTNRFLRHVLKDALEHGRATWQHGKNVRILANVSVALSRIVMESFGFFANEIWLEQYIGTTETFSVDRDDVSVWELESLLLVDDTTMVYKFSRMSTWNGSVPRSVHKKSQKKIRSWGHVGYSTLWWSNHLKTQRGWSWRCQTLSHALTGPLELGRVNGNTTVAYKTLRMSTLHFVMLERRVVDPLASLQVECGWKDIPTHGDVWRQQ